MRKKLAFRVVQSGKEKAERKITRGGGVNFDQQYLRTSQAKKWIEGRRCTASDWRFAPSLRFGETVVKLDPAAACGALHRTRRVVVPGQGAGTSPCRLQALNDVLFYRLGASSTRGSIGPI